MPPFPTGVIRGSIRDGGASYGQPSLSRKVNTPGSQFSLVFRDSPHSPFHQSLSCLGVSARTPIRAARRTFWLIGELSEVLRAQGVQPAHLASFVADDDPGQDRAGVASARSMPARASALSAIWLKARPTPWANAAKLIRAISVAVVRR